jgi:pimeloyl-ACP methyl ester carboxylesterase
MLLCLLEAMEGGVVLRGEYGQVLVDGRSLETLAYPPAVADRPTIVMLHEGLGSVSMWRDSPEQIAGITQCGVLAYSRYGHGKSDALREPRGAGFMHHEARVVLPALLQAFSIERPILLGHSDGGSICLIYAGNPQATAPLALILEAPHVFVEDLTVSSITKVKEEYAATGLRARLSRHHDHVDEMFQGWVQIWLDPVFRSWNIESTLSGVRCPVLVIQGQQDEYGTLAQVTAIQERLPDAEIALLKDCGHSPHRDQREATLKAIAEFVRRLW